MNTLILPATMGNLEALIEFVLSAATELHFDAKAQAKLRLAAEEILVNVISYAYPGGTGDISILTESTVGREGLRVNISDTGIPFDPLSQPSPDLNVPVQDRKVGGLGIFLLREIMDHVAYRRENGRNILTFTKFLQEKP